MFRIDKERVPLCASSVAVFFKTLSRQSWRGIGATGATSSATWPGATTSRLVPIPVRDWLEASGSAGKGSRPIHPQTCGATTGPLTLNLNTEKTRD